MSIASSETTPRTGDAEAPTSGSRRTAMRLASSLMRYSPRRVIEVLVMTLGVSVTSGVSLVMLVPFLGLAGLDVGDGSVGRISAVAVGALQRLGLTPTVPAVVGLYLAVVAGGAWLARIQAVRTTELYQGFVMHLRRSAYRSMTDVSWTYFARHKAAHLLHVLTQELERVGGATSALMQLTSRLLLTSIYLGLALFVSPATTALVLVLGGVLGLLLLQKTRAGREKGEQVSAAYEALYETIAEQLAGMRITKSHGLEAWHVRLFGDRTVAAAGSLTAVVRNQASVGFWLEVGSATILASIFLVSLLVLDLPIASLLLLLYLFARLVPMLTGLQRGVLRVLDLLPAFDRFTAFCRRLDAHAEATDSDPSEVRLRRELRMDGVTFAYGDDGSALEKVDLVVPAGSTVAIVGPSGSGKSTLADLAVGLVSPTRGEIRIDGAPLAGAARRAWRRNVGYVNQDTFLFHDSIRENLRLASPQADEDEMRAALLAASAEFVAALPDGLDTVVGDRGVRLSGGERQRIALARAILRRPDLLVLDEATSALDAENEVAIQRAIDRLSGQRTILLIAHRLSTVRAADRIYVVERGRVVEEGSWDELVRRPAGRFATFCRAQGVPLVAGGVT